MHYGKPQLVSLPSTSSNWKPDSWDDPLSRYDVNIVIANSVVAMLLTLNYEKYPAQPINLVSSAKISLRNTNFQSITFADPTVPAYNIYLSVVKITYDSLKEMRDYERDTKSDITVSAQPSQVESSSSPNQKVSIWFNNNEVPVNQPVDGQSAGYVLRVAAQELALSASTGKMNRQYQDNSQTTIGASNAVQTQTFQTMNSNELDIIVTPSSGNFASQTMTVSVSQDNTTFYQIDSLSLGVSTKFAVHYSESKLGTGLPINPVNFPYVQISIPALGAGIKSILVISGKQ